MRILLTQSVLASVAQESEANLARIYFGFRIADLGLNPRCLRNKGRRGVPGHAEPAIPFSQSAIRNYPQLPGLPVTPPITLRTAASGAESSNVTL
jgi:hypothetical protein